MKEYKNLIWFNKEGDYLNFKFNEDKERYEGNLIFDINSSDTFKTIGLYLFEKVRGFEYDADGKLMLDKFQLFNEYGINFYGSKYLNEKIEKIEPVNNHPEYFSKWIYGVDFEKKFPIGSLICFLNPILEFTNPNITYVVVSSKKNAIMIISSIDNETFDNIYGYLYNDNTIYNNIYISGINAIGIYDYIDENLNNKLSKWSEPNFYDKLYNNKKINIINSKSNKNNNNKFKEKIVTVKNSTINDNIYYEYHLSFDEFPDNCDLMIKVTTRTDNIIAYEGPINIINNRVYFNSVVPEILKPGSKFKIIGSNNNIFEYTIDNIPEFSLINQVQEFNVDDLVIWNNKIYKCIQSYTQNAVYPYNSQYWDTSLGPSSGYIITPDNNNYWILSDFVPISEQIVNEVLLNGKIYMVNDVFVYNHAFNSNKIITLATFAEKYKNTFSLFKINLKFENNKLISQSQYPSKYVDVEYYYIQSGNLYSVGNTIKKYEKLIEIKEELIPEKNRNLSENFEYNIVFEKLDQYGINIKINGDNYPQEILWVYSGINIDMERTIDYTIRTWYFKYLFKLGSLGIIPELHNAGPNVSPYFNCIKLKTEYPNVPLKFKVYVGNNAKYHIEHSIVTFNELGKYLNIKINNKNYGIEAVEILNQIDINETLKAWCNEYSDLLKEYGIYVKNINNSLKFSIKNQDTKLKYDINIGKLIIPGQFCYKIKRELKGSVGTFLTSNEIVIPDNIAFSFIIDGFSTGMILSLNNTAYPLMNVDYVILYLNDKRINLSYEGPFWGTIDAECISSPYVNIAFNLGYSQTLCPQSQLSGDGGPFNPYQFNPNYFTINITSNNYSAYTYNLNNLTNNNVTNIVDIIYITLSDYIYVLGNNIGVIDAINGEYLTYIELNGNNIGVKLEFNPINNCLYALTHNGLYVINPLSNTVITVIQLNGTPSDIVINKNNGDIYVSYNDYDYIDVFDVYNNLVTSIQISASVVIYCAYKMVYNSYENSIYVITNYNDTLYKINGQTRTIQTQYIIPGLSSMSPSQYDICYEPVNDSIYLFGYYELYNVDGSTITQISSVQTQLFNKILFNNINNKMYISTTTNFICINNNNTVDYSINTTEYGYMEINQYEGKIYMSSQTTNNIIVINPNDGSVEQSIPVSDIATKMIYNPYRKTIWSIIPNANTVVEISANININLLEPQNVTYQISDNAYGTLNPNYKKYDHIWLKTRDFIRWPRCNYSDDVRVTYYYRWLTDNVPEIFLYDISGEQLEKTGPYKYTGVKPLNGDLFLNRKPNRDINKTSDPSAQQTVFDRLYFDLKYLDEPIDDVNIEPEPIQIFIGFNSSEEGVLRSILQLYKRENIKFDIIPNNYNDHVLEFSTFVDDDGKRYGKIDILSYTLNFLVDENNKKRGLKPGQLLKVEIVDVTNKKNQYISNNNGMILKIKNVYSKTLILEYLGEKEFDKETNIIFDYPKNGIKTYLKTTFTVIDKEIARFNVMGQTEIEDVRFNIELKNIGKNINNEDVYIFKEYDINEGGVDWKFLNYKRKEMLMNKGLIYPYIGSYKSIINAINFFGYNDLELYEYYRNINIKSPNFNKLFKIEIPDIFDNSVEGWKENDFIKNTLPNENYEYTNLFNLTYNITDKDGNNVLLYSLKEIQIKLMGLKKWLEKNIIPITHKILDITGRAHFVGCNSIVHRNYDIKIIKINENFSPVTFKLNEAYLNPVKSGSSKYTCVLDFYISYNGILINLNTDYNKYKKYLPDNYDIKIRTYKTYEEWEPFKTYNTGDKVVYYGKIYESVINNNKMNNPKKYSSSKIWNDNITFVNGQIYKYKNRYYIYTGESNINITTIPPNDADNWVDITEWKEVNYEPVQIIDEYRNINITTPYLFTIDVNIDPYIVIEVISYNGYGVTFNDKKSYEIKSIIKNKYKTLILDELGPFEPINSPTI